MMRSHTLAAAALSAWCAFAGAQSKADEVACVTMLAEAADRADKAARFYRLDLGEEGRQAASQARSLERQANECRASVEPMSHAANVVWREQQELYESNMQILAAVVRAILESRE